MLIGDNGPDAPIKIDVGFTGQRPEQGRQRRGIPELAAIFSGTSRPIFYLRARQLKNVIVRAKPGYHVKPPAKLIAQGLKQPVVAEPGVGDR